MSKKLEQWLDTLSDDQREYLLSHSSKIVFELKEKDFRKEEMLENDKYISWLIHYTASHPVFSTYSLDVEQSEEDIQNAKDISLFFEIIKEYADKNYVEMKGADTYGGYYLVRYNNVGFEIGVYTGQGTFFTCTRIEIEDSKYYDFIDFEMVMSDTPLPSTSLIVHKLNRFSQITREAAEVVPAFYIKVAFKSIMDEIEKNKK